MHPELAFPPEPTIARFPTAVIRLAALWVAAGAFFKLFAGSPNDLPPAVKDFFLGPDLTFRLAIATELIFVSAALLRPKWGWVWLVAIFATFLVVLLLLVLQLMRTEELSFLQAAFSPKASCGCFGSTIKIPPGWMMLIDGGFLVLILAGRPWRRHLGHWAPTFVPTGLAVVGAAVPFVLIPPSVLPTEVVIDEETGTARVADGPRYVTIELAEWMDQCIYDLDFFNTLIEGVEELPVDGSFVFYRLSCDHCRQHIGELAANDDLSKPFVFIRVPEKDDADQEPLVQTFPIGDHVFHRSLPEGTEYVLTTPADAEVLGCVVTAYREGIGLDGE